MSARESLILDVNGGMSVGEAADKHGVARSCAYKWVSRYRDFGWPGLEENSRAPEHSPNRTPQKIVDELLALKRKHPDFGPAKLAPMLEVKHGKHVMSVSTAGELLARHGLVVKRRQRGRSAGPIERGPFTVSGAGDSMTADFKGQFWNSKLVCYPLTIADPFSRFVLTVDALSSTGMADTMARFERVFRKYGLPRQMISDNGTPFCASNSLGGLTQLSRRWIELGITPIRIAPGRPQQNGSHERMHRTFKAWIRRHPRASLRAHQRSFDAFRHEFNHVRPHQSLGQKLPASAFKPYKPFSSRIRKIEYDTNMTVRSVRSNGCIKWEGSMIYTSEVLTGAHIGLLEIGEGAWSIHFGAVRVGYLDAIANRVQNRLPDRLLQDDSSGQSE
jgi:transposase InsO family protein/transposase-like protein